jgi:hypothetical protein
VAIGAGSAIALKPVQPSVDKVKQTAEDGNATFPATIVIVHRFERIATPCPILGNGDRV